MKGAVVIALLLAACGATPPSAARDDGDRVSGAADACPDAPEDEDGFRDDDGCPDLDDDADGIADVDDLCRCESEDRDGFEDHDGCPDPDNDADRIADACDLCPSDPETYNGHCDEDGCPDRGHVCVSSSRIVILEELHFARGRSSVGRGDGPIVEALAATLAGNPQIGLVAVVGETEPREAGALALDRANTVIEALVAHGVARERLVADVAVAERRVRFTIRVLGGAPYDQDDGYVEPSGDCRASPCEVPVCEPPAPIPPTC